MSPSLNQSSVPRAIRSARGSVLVGSDMASEPLLITATPRVPRLYAIAIHWCHFLLVILAGWGPFQARSQISFLHTFGVDTLYEEGAAVIQTADGGFLIAGTEVVPDPIQVAKGNGVLLKTNEFGEEIWRRVFIAPGTHSLSFNHLITNTGGQYVITGTYEYEWNASPTNHDVFLALCDTAGEEVWSARMGGTHRDLGSQVRELPDGGYAVCGTRWVTPTNMGEGAACLARFDSLGDSIWMRTYPGPAGGTQTAYCLEVGLDSGYYLGGAQESIVGTCAYVMRTDQQGDTLWTLRLNPLFDGDVRDIALSPDDGVVLTGYSTVTGWSRPYLAKVDLEGELIWNKTYPMLDPGWAFGLCQTATGYALFGMTSEYEFRTIAVDFDGEFVWSHTIEPDTGFEYGYDIAPTADGGFVMTGVTGMSADIVLIKTNANGQITTDVHGASAIVDRGARVFPNPTDRFATVEYTMQHAEPAHARLLDAAGQEVSTVHSLFSGLGLLTIDLEGLPSGPYMIEVGSQAESWTLHVIKQ